MQKRRAEVDNPSYANMDGILFSHSVAFCPPPLRIQKKPRRATFRRRIFRRSPQVIGTGQHISGPLDDIIDEIRSNIWQPPLQYSFDPFSRELTPLPVSRIPNEKPLTIRKHRNTQSLASDSNMCDRKSDPRTNYQTEISNDTTGRCLDSGTTPWPLLDTVSGCQSDQFAEITAKDISTGHSSAQQSLETVVLEEETRLAPSKQRRPSRLRLFTNGFPRLRRNATGDTLASIADASSTISPTTTTTTTPLISPANDNDEDLTEPSDEAVEAYIKKNARNSEKLRSVVERMAKRIPSPEQDDNILSQETITQSATAIPTTLRAAIRIVPQIKIISEDLQDFYVAIEIEGVILNRSTTSSASLDVILVVDNGYYVTQDCLKRASDAINGALYHFRRSDRVALYTTHCTHNVVTGNRPEQHFPLRPFNKDIPEIFNALTTSICRHGTQAWQPARPNPSMTEVVLSIARSIKDQDLKRGHSHIVLMSPAAYFFHDVSRNFPDLCIHLVNPAVLPYQREAELQDTICFERCCKNVFVSSWSSYQSVSRRVKRILKDARSPKPVGEITDVTIDIRTRAGCEMIDFSGCKDIPQLRLGQMHTCLVRIQVDKRSTRPVDIDSINPIFTSSLDAKGLKQDLQNAIAVGAVKVHLLDVQLYHRNSLHAIDCWNYSESPLLMIRELGGLSPPIDTALEVFRRQYFHTFTQLSTELAETKANDILATLGRTSQLEQGVVECMAKEITCHKNTQKYESSFRQTLPLCPGPIDIEASHDWLIDAYEQKKNKRKGMAGVQEEAIRNLIDGINVQKRPV